MTSTQESASRSNLNGKTMESKICELIPSFEYQGGEIDGILDGVLVEIKSCQYKVKHGQYTRAGRMFFTQEQHKTLLAKNGVYILLVQDDSEVIHSKIVKAALLFTEFEKQYKTCSWTSIFNINIHNDKNKITV